MMDVGTSVRSMSDTELVLRCVSRDQDAWVELVRRYERLIYTIPLRSGFDHDAAADIFQQVFLILSKNIHQIRDGSNVRAWLVTTTKREMLRVIRLRDRRREAANSDDETGVDVIETIAEDRILQDEELEKLEMKNAVSNAMSELGERCRELIFALFYEDPSPSYSEISRRLSISEGSIGPTRARCLGKLERLLRL